jgi:hypothetical protein
LIQLPKEPATADELRQICAYSVREDQFSAVLRWVTQNVTVATSDRIDWGHFATTCVICWCISTLRGWFTEKEYEIIAGQITGGLVARMQDLEEGGPDAIPKLCVGFVECQLLFMTGWDRFYDIKAEEIVEDLPFPPIISTTIDVYALLTIYFAQLDNLRRDNNAVDSATNQVHEAKSDTAGQGRVRDDDPADTD